ncbi:MAG TPA: hypothetical protein VFV33_25515 [Gemmatimonadaceae bacterium]|nr:hypothetical protein [Gemmatimonadaceae bacterium]
MARALAAAAVVAGLAAVAAPPADPSPAGSAVAVALDEWKLVPAQLSVRPGRIALIVRNDGEMDHELVVLRSDLHHHRLAVNGGRAVEKGRVAELPLIPSGATRRLTLTVRPGKYVLLCNLLGHYQAGQYAALRVR